jgi:hypothetical protein
MTALPSLTQPADAGGNQVVFDNADLPGRAATNPVALCASQAPIPIPGERPTGQCSIRAQPDSAVPLAKPGLFVPKPNARAVTVGQDGSWPACVVRPRPVTLALDVKGGFLYGVVTTTDGGKTFSGKVTGGTGAFKGATGTITGKAISSTKTAITIIYS